MLINISGLEIDNIVLLASDFECICGTCLSEDIGAPPLRSNIFKTSIECHGTFVPPELSRSLMLDGLRGMSQARITYIEQLWIS